MLSKILANSPHKKKYYLNSLWMFGGFTVRYGLNLLVSIYVARYLQPEGFGTLNYASTFMQLLAPLAFLGLHGIVIRDLVKGEASPEKILGTAFYIKAAASVITLALIILLVQFSENDSGRKLLVILASASLLASPLGVIDFFFQAKVQSKYIVYAQQISYIFTSLLRLLLIYYKAPISAFVFVVFLDAALAALFLLIFYKIKGHEVKKWSYDVKIGRTFFREIPKVVLADFFIVLYMRIDQLMIDKLMNTTALGIYSAAVKLCEPFYMVATLLIASLLPAIVNGLKISQDEYKKRMQRLFNVLTWVAIFTSVVVCFLSTFIIDVLYDDEFAEAAPILALYFWSSVFIFQGSLASQAYLTEKKQQYAVYYTLGGAIINILLNIYWIPKYGLKGSSYATLVSYACSGFIFNFFFKDTRSIFYQQLWAFVAVFTKPRNLVRQFYIDKKD